MSQSPRGGQGFSLHLCVLAGTHGRGLLGHGNPHLGDSQSYVQRVTVLVWDHQAGPSILHPDALSVEEGLLHPDPPTQSLSQVDQREWRQDWAGDRDLKGRHPWEQQL